MDLMENLGISYKANYLIQGNQIERCNVSNKLNVLNTELMLRTDGKDSNIDNILKNYKGNITFHLPAINPDLSNLDVVNNVVKTLKEHNINLITIEASNLLLDLFEWSTVEEQKKYFLNMVTAIATIASNKINVAIQNLKPNDKEPKFGCTMSQITDLMVYSKRLLVKDFGIKEEEADKLIGISLNVDNINLVDEIKFNNDIENKIVKELSLFPQVVDSLLKSNESAHLTKYIFNVAGLFSKLYEQVNISNEEDIILKSSRIRLLNCISKVITSALKILGIETIEKL